ncbi:GAF domain-containing protein [Arthrobacter subterraneus]|uniref:GAF domain-containing protein n=1 Tax=Arthrobacter subterraneus TaxID=335973 RepID=A0A1G8N6Q2_9MICC|nr:GAF domain-containing protein [Arthrobacter subterraneus]SDI75854.1 GAF domain-containing protein [Arthrobacter subterraneus]
MNEQVQVKTTTLALSEAELSIEDLWVRYYGLGGAISAFEVQSYLSGLLSLPPLERNLLADATNELLELTPVQIRVPADDEGGADVSAEDSLRALGAAGAFLLSVEEQESERLAALDRTRLLDSIPESRFDRYTQQAKDHFQVSSSIIALLDDRRMFLKSVLGPIEQNLPREITFCHATIRNAGPLIITDALADERFQKNPLVLGEPFIRFYAGHPLRGPRGWTVGTLCIIDQKPHDFSEKDCRFLQKLARLVEEEINS